MFYGAQIKPGKPVTPTEEDGGEILHLSQLCLVDPKDAAKTYVQIDDGKNTYCIAVLQKDKCEHVSVDLFVSTVSGVKFLTKGGNNEVDVVGYFEPEGLEDDEIDSDDENFADQFSKDGKLKGMDDDDNDEDDDDDDDDEDDVEIAKQLKNIKAGKMLNNKMANKKNKLKNITDEDDEDEEEDDEEDDEEDEDDDDDDEEIDDEEIDDEEKDEETEKKVKLNSKGDKSKNTTGQNKQSNANVNNTQKRKIENKVTNNEAKKAKVENKTAGDNENFQEELVKFLKVNGRTNLGTLGQKVKKPSNIDKLGHFLKEYPTIFKVENGFVSLAK